MSCIYVCVSSILFHGKPRDVQRTWALLLGSGVLFLVVKVTPEYYVLGV